MCKKGIFDNIDIEIESFNLMADDENKSDVVIENFYLISEILFHLVSSSIVRADIHHILGSQ
jgi:hypothetical protein